MPWNKLSSTTLTTTGDSIDSGTITASTFNTIIGHVISSSTDINRLSRFNGDTGNNYQNRYSSNGGSDATSTSGSTMFTNSTGAQYNEFGVAFFADVSGEEKMLISNAVGDSASTGAGTAPVRRNTISKWTGTADVTVVNGLNSDVGDYIADSNVMIMGSEVPVAAIGTNLQVGSRYEETDTRKVYNFRAGSTPTVSDDFSSDNWTDVGGLFGVSGGNFAFTINTNARDDHASLDTGSLLSASTTWTLRFNKINFSTITNNDPNLIVGLSDTTVGGKQNQKFIGARILPQGGSASGLFRPYSVNGTPPRSGQDASHTLQYSADTDYFVEIKKTSASTYRARLSTTSAHSGDLIDDSQGGINSSITGRYIKVMNGEDEIGGTLIGTIDSIEFWTPAPDEPINTSNHFKEIGA